MPALRRRLSVAARSAEHRLNYSTVRLPKFLSAFRIQSYRFQWGSDLLNSWAFEMETLILGWFVLVTTDSPFLLAAFAALTFSGTLLSPFFGVLADRVDRRAILIILRLIYGALASAILLLALVGTVQPWQVFVISGIAGLVRPSDFAVKFALIADTVPTRDLHNAMGFSRATMDSARIFGALLGAGLFSTLGIGAAYGAVVGLYLASVLLAWRITPIPRQPTENSRPWTDLKLGFSYIRRNETIVAIMALAFLANFTGFPMIRGLLPALARDVYAMDETGLAQLIALLAMGALLGSLATATVLRVTKPVRMMVIWLVIWHLFILLLGLFSIPMVAGVVITVIGLAQSFAMIPMSVLLLKITDEVYRGRVSGVRMLAVYGMPMGLLTG
ncbi:MAG: arabinose ABC transporter permease, partial [Gammaproteobacteria bacterium]